MIDFRKYKSYREIVEDIWLPQALAYGVPYETFWKLNPRKLKSFRKAHEIKIKEETQLNDFFAWMNGKYVAYAIGCTMGDGDYPEEPDSIEEQKTDAQRFAEFMEVHNQQLADERRRKNGGK